MSVTLPGVRRKKPRREEQCRGVRCAEAGSTTLRVRVCPGPRSARLSRHALRHRPACTLHRALAGPEHTHTQQQAWGHPQGRAPCTPAPSVQLTDSNLETRVSTGNTATSSTTQPVLPPPTPNTEVISEATRPCGWAAGPAISRWEEEESED